MKTFDDTLKELRSRRNTLDKLARIERLIKDENVAMSVATARKQVNKEWNRFNAGWIPCDGAVFEL